MRTLCLPVLLLAFLQFATGCSGQNAQEGPDLLIGTWKVINIARGGQNMGGPGFKGSTFEFRENGTVFSQSYSGDSTTVKYAHRGDSLFNYTESGTETYLIDSLSQTRLIFTAPNKEFGDATFTLKRVEEAVRKSH